MNENFTQYIDNFTSTITYVTKSYVLTKGIRTISIYDVRNGDLSSNNRATDALRLSLKQTNFEDALLKIINKLLYEGYVFFNYKEDTRNLPHYYIMPILRFDRDSFDMPETIYSEIILSAVDLKTIASEFYERLHHSTKEKIRKIFDQPGAGIENPDLLSEKFNFTKIITSSVKKAEMITGKKGLKGKWFTIVKECGSDGLWNKAHYVSIETHSEPPFMFSELPIGNDCFGSGLRYGTDKLRRMLDRIMSSTMSSVMLTLNPSLMVAGNEVGAIDEIDNTYNAVTFFNTPDPNSVAIKRIVDMTASSQIGMQYMVTLEEKVRGVFGIERFTDTYAATSDETLSRQAARSMYLKDISRIIYTHIIEKMIIASRNLLANFGNYGSILKDINNETIEFKYDSEAIIDRTSEHIRKLNAAFDMMAKISSIGTDTRLLANPVRIMKNVFETFNLDTEMLVTSDQYAEIINPGAEDESGSN